MIRNTTDGQGEVLAFLLLAMLFVFAPLHLLIAAGGVTPIGVTVVSDLIAPSVPTGLLATANSSSQIGLSWIASTDNIAVTGYRIRRDGALIASTSGITYTDSGLSASTQYSYTVEAFDSIPNYSGQSSVAYATTSAPSGGGGGGGDTTPPTVSSFVPVNNATAVATNTTLTINFSEPIRKLSGNIRLRRLSDDFIIESIPVSSSQVVIAGSSAIITPGTFFAESTQYYVEADVSTFDDQSSNSFAGFSGSGTWRFTTRDSIAPMISNIIITPATSSAVVNWNTNESAQGILRWGTTTDYNDGTLVEGGYTNIHSNLLTGISPSTLYYYQIVAMDPSGNSSTSTGVFTTNALPDVTPPANVSNLVATPSLIQVALSWTNPADGDFSAVRILRKTTGYPSGPADGVLVYDGAGTSIIDSAVSTSTTYYYGVFARDTSGNYASGAIVSATVPTDVITPPPPPPPGDDPPPPGGETPPTSGGGTNIPPSSGGTTTPPSATTSTPFDFFPPIGQLPPILRGLSFDDFEVYVMTGQGNKRVPVIRSVAKIDGESPFILSVPKDKLPDTLKTIAVTLRHPKGGDFSFLLTLEKDGTAYSASVDSLLTKGKFPLTVSILDVDSRTARIVTGVLDVIYESPLPTTPLEVVTEAIDQVRAPVRNIAPVVTPIGVAVGASELVLVTTNIRSFYDLYLFFLKMIGLITGIFRRRKHEPWGVVYDSVTKRPLDPAYVIAQDQSSKKSGGEAITDLDGRYGFILKPGEYVIVANKTHYRFPSTQLQGKSKDEFYDNLYFGENFGVKEGDIARYNIPLDPIEFDWNEFAKQKDQVFKVYSKRDRIRLIIFNTLYFVGFTFSLFAAYLEPTKLNIIMCAVYGLILLFQVIWKSRHKISQVRTKEGRPIPFALIKLFLSGTQTMVKKVVADEFGKFYFLVPPGSYTLTVEEKQPDATYRKVLETGVLELRKGVLKDDLILG